MEQSRPRKHYSETITPGVEPGGGLVCEHCGCRHFRVVYTRPHRAGGVLRRRECRHCGRRLTTIEQPRKAPDGDVEAQAD